MLEQRLAGGYVARGDAHGSAHLAYGGEHVCAAWLKQSFLGKRPRRDETNDVALYQGLGAATLSRLGGRLGLLGYGNAATRLDQPGKISLGGMDRHPAHRHWLPAILAPASERDVQNLRGDPRIVEEHLEEVAHAIKQQAVFRLRLESVILGHHRGRSVAHGPTA